MSAKLLVNKLPLKEDGGSASSLGAGCALTRMTATGDGSIDLRILPLQVLQVSLQVVVGRGSGLQVIVDLSCLLGRKKKNDKKNK